MKVHQLIFKLLELPRNGDIRVMIVEPNKSSCVATSSVSLVHFSESPTVCLVGTV